MNVNYILNKDFIKIGGQKIFPGNSFNEIETKTGLTFFISIQNDNYIIASEQEFQLHFKENILCMWTISPEKSFFTLNSKKKRLNEIKFESFLKILFNKKIKWEFNRELTFLDQICIQLENKVEVIFGFDKKNRKGYIGKIGWTKQLQL